MRGWSVQGFHLSGLSDVRSPRLVAAQIAHVDSVRLRRGDDERFAAFAGLNRFRGMPVPLELAAVCKSYVNIELIESH